jgi:hypothetical protein
MTAKTLRLPELCCLIALALPCASFAVTNVPPVVPDRYLFVLDVSAPMRPRAQAVQQAVTSLLVSGFHGQIKDGDEIGIWTFNNQLHSGDFPLLSWKESERNDLTRKVLNFVSSLTYANETRFDQVRPDLLAVVKDSYRITVILVCDGDEVIQGTPFDLSIAKYFQENAAELKTRKAPIIIVMRGYKGQFIGHKISYPPWPLELPFFPAEPEPVKVPEPVEPPKQEADATPTDGLLKGLATTNKGPIVYAEPLIVRGGDRPAREAALKPAPTNAMPAPAIPSNALAANVASGEGSPPQTRSNVASPATLPPSGSDETAVTSVTPLATEAGEETSGTGKWLGLIGVGVIALVVVGAAAWFLRRKPRSTGGTSLITRSMKDRGDRRR